MNFIDKAGKWYCEGCIGYEEELFPPQFNYRTTLSFDVPADGAETADFDLASGRKS